jgi:hypothetical protein
MTVTAHDKAVKCALERAYHFAISAENCIEAEQHDARVTALYHETKATRKSIGAALAELIVREETEVLFTAQR